MADLTRVESFQYPSGHYAHLTDNQQQQLEAFKQLCQEGGYYTPAGVGGTPDASHDDETLLYVARLECKWRGTNGTQALSARTAFRGPRSLQAVQGHRGLAERAWA